MIILSEKETEQIDGGFLGPLVQAILIGVAVFAAPKAAKDSKDYLNKIGSGLGKAAWEINHPYDPNK